MFGFVKRNGSLFTDPYTILALYFTLVRSKLEYATLIWNPFTTTHGNRIERLQKQFLKFALLPLRFLDPVPSYHQQCCSPSILAICFVHVKRAFNFRKQCRAAVLSRCLHLGRSHCRPLSLSISALSHRSALERLS